jgi:hypothetical protein
MMMLSTAVRVYIAAEPIDMRKSIDSLSMLVRPMFDQDALICDGCQYVAARHLGIQHIAENRCFRVTVSSSLPPHNI